MFWKLFTLFFLVSCGSFPQSNIKTNHDELQSLYDKKFTDKVTAYNHADERAFARLAKKLAVEGYAEENTRLTGWFGKKKCTLVKGSTFKLLSRTDEKREIETIFEMNSTEVPVQESLKCPLDGSQVLAKNFSKLDGSSVSATLEGKFSYAQIEITDVPKNLKKGDCTQGESGKVWLVSCVSDIQNINFRDF